MPNHRVEGIRVHWWHGPIARVELPAGLDPEVKTVFVGFEIEPDNAAFRLAVLSDRADADISHRLFAYMGEPFYVCIPVDHLPATVAFWLEKLSGRQPRTVKVVSVDPGDERTMRNLRARHVALH